MISNDTSKCGGKIMKFLKKNGSMPIEICPLCYEELDGKKSHGSWCK